MWSYLEYIIHNFIRNDVKICKSCVWLWKRRWNMIWNLFCVLSQFIIWHMLYATCIIGAISRDMTHVVLVWYTFIYQMYKSDATIIYYDMCYIGVMWQYDRTLVSVRCQTIWHLLCGRDVTWYDTCCVGIMSHDKTPVVWAWCHDMTPVVWAWYYCNSNMTLVLQLWCHNYDTCSIAMMSLLPGLADEWQEAWLGELRGCNVRHRSK